MSVRQALAIAIILYSHTLLFNNKTKKSMFFFSLSMFWHKSAVLAFLFMGLYFLKANRIKVTALLFMGLVLIKTVSVHSLIMSIPFIDSLPFSHHLHSELFKPPGLGSGLGVLVKLSLPLVSMFFILTFLNENKDRKLDYIFKINVLVLFFTVLATEVTIVNRVTLLLYYIIPLSYVVIRSSLVKAIHKHFFDLSFISCCLVFFIMTVQFGKGTYQILPYTTFL